MLAKLFELPVNEARRDVLEGRSSRLDFDDDDVNETKLREEADDAALLVPAPPDAFVDRVVAISSWVAVETSELRSRFERGR